MGRATNSETKINLDEALAAAVDAAREAGVLLREEFHGAARPSAGIDRRIENVLRERLLARFRWGWHGEETADLHIPGAPVWVVDPHDGTAAFTQRRRGSAVSIALVSEGRPVLGVVYAFAAPDDEGDLFAWAEGCGPLTRNGRSVTQPLVGCTLSPSEVVAVSHDAADAPEANARLAAPARFLAVPSIAYRLALAAAGEVVAAVSVQTLSAWDVAAGHALLLGVGGTLVDGRGREVLYGAGGQAGVASCFGGSREAVAELHGRSWREVLAARKEAPPTPLPSRRVADPVRLARVSIGVET
jgi:fructose-1,6-bisphosphatase/inositol monophosphatase family enzyme